MKAEGRMDRRRKQHRPTFRITPCITSERAYHREFDNEMDGAGQIFWRCSAYNSQQSTPATRRRTKAQACA